MKDLARQQLQQANALLDYPDTAKQNVLRTPLQFADVNDLLDRPEDATQSGEPPLDTIQHILQHIDNALVAVYQQFKTEQLAPELTEIFRRTSVV